MSLETGSFIKDLVSSNPPGNDNMSQGDDHLRLIKAVLKSQFSGFTQGKAITKTEDQINSGLQTGDFGLGGPIVNITETQAQAADLATGFYLVNDQGLGFLPTAASYYMLYSDHTVDGYAERSFSHLNTGETYIQVKSANVWGAHRRIWDSVNLPKPFPVNVAITDANSAIAAGLYQLNSPYTNGPTATAYALIVTQHGGNAEQIAMGIQLASEQWIRTNVGGTWSAWRRTDQPTRTMQTPARAANTTYTNSTFMDIEVNVWLASAQNCSYSATVNGIGVAVGGISGTGASFAHAFNFTVPPGGTYQVTVTGTTIAGWSELRL